MRAIGTVDAAVARFRCQNGVALLAFIEPLTGIRRHGFAFDKTALRTGEGGLQ